MNNFFTSCKKCLSPKMLIIVGTIIVALFIFVPIIGISGLLVTAPLIGCTVICGAMVFLMRGEKKGD